MSRRWAVILLLLIWVPVARAQGPTSQQKEETVRWLLALERESGGFAGDAKPESPATVGSTSSALRAIKYFGAEAPSKDNCARFVKSCIDSKTGGFASTPGGKADPRTTAIGLMAWIELQLPPGAEVEKALGYLVRESQAFEDRRMTAAAFETVKQPCPVAPEWIQNIKLKQNPDGSYGSGGARARETANAAMTILRLGGKIDDPARIAGLLRAEQRAAGGWGKSGEASDLETSYRVMRTLKMLGEKPNKAACRTFISRCRNSDGAYAVQPGQPGTLSGTYFAGIILHWLEEMK